MLRPDGRASARKSFVLLVVGMVVFFLCSVASADVPDSINYQGKLTTAAGGCVNDTVQMTFSIYPDTLPATSADWTETQMQVVVKDGIFNVLLGSVTPLPASLFDGNAKYLGVQVESDPEMRPLKPMVSVAYAFRSEFSDTAEYARAAPAMPDDDWVIDGDNIYRELGNVGIGTTNPGTYKLNVNGTGYFGAQLNIMDPNYYLQLSGSDARIIFDSGSDWFRFDRTNNAYDFIIAADKVFSAKSASQYLRGNVGIGTLSPAQKLDVAGTAQMTGFKMPTDASTGRVLTSDASGVGTWQTPPSGIGGSGTTNYIPKFTASTTLGNSAIYQSGSSVGIGTTSPSYRLDIYMPSGSSESGALRIQNSNNKSGNYGIRTEVNGVGTANYGAYIKVENPTTVGYGIWAAVENGGSNSNFGGFFGSIGSGGNWNYGVQGMASVSGANLNYGVYGVATNATNNYGVYGSASGGTNNWAGYFSGNLYASGNVGIGTTAPTGKLHVETDKTYAGYFTSDSLSSNTHVVHAEYTGTSYHAKAVYGKSRPVDGWGVGGCFEGGSHGVDGEVIPTGNSYYLGVFGLVSGGSGTNYGVYGSASGGSTNYGVYYSGGLAGTGTKSCVVKTSKGPALLYCQESPENWFEDFGEGRLINGRTRIELDPLFLETVTIGGTNPMKVFVQLEGDCNGVYVSKGTSGFDVVEFKGGTSNVPFSYRVVAKRKGFEERRLDYTAAGENDPYLYPEAAERMEKERREKTGAEQ